MERLTMCGAILAGVLGLATVALASASCFDTLNCGRKGSLTKCYLCCEDCSSNTNNLACQDSCDATTFP